MTVRTDHRLDQFEDDPRWEVQPEPDHDDDPGSNGRVTLIAAVTMAVVVGLLASLVIESPPGY